MGKNNSVKPKMLGSLVQLNAKFQLLDFRDILTGLLKNIAHDFRLRSMFILKKESHVLVLLTER